MSNFVQCFLDYVSKVGTSQAFSGWHKICHTKLYRAIQLSDLWGFSRRYRELELAPTGKILKQKIEIMGELNASAKLYLTYF